MAESACGGKSAKHQASKMEDFKNQVSASEEKSVLIYAH